MKIKISTKGYRWVVIVGTLVICGFHLLCFSGAFSFWHLTSGENLLEHYYNTVSMKIGIDSGQDVGLYYRYGMAALQGELPYSDFVSEYPPLALPFMIAPTLVTSEPVGYGILFALEMSIFAVATAIIVIRYLEKHSPKLVHRFTLLFLASLFLFGHVAISRLDPVSAFFLVLTTCFCLEKKPLGAGIAGAVGFGIKLFPVLALIPYGVYLLYRKNWRFLVTLIVTFVVTSALVWAGPISINSQGVLGSFLYHTQRGLQIESVMGLPVWILHLFTRQTEVVFTYGSLNFDSTLSDSISKLALPLFVFFALGIVALTFIRLGRANSNSQNTPVKTLFMATFLLLLGFIVFNKVFSPQYMLWIVWLAFLGLPHLPRPRTAFWALFLTIQLATFVLFPILYGDLISGELYAVGLAIARNLAMLALLVWATIDFNSSSFRLVPTIKSTEQTNPHIHTYHQPDHMLSLSTDTSRKFEREHD